jgi:ribonuclease P protein component
MLPKSKRLTTEAFKEIIEKGRSFHSPFLITRISLSEGSTKFAVSVPKKVSKLAVNRNKIHRRVYSILRHLPIISGFRVVIIMKIGSQNLSFVDLSSEIEKIFVKSGLLK